MNIKQTPTKTTFTLLRLEAFWLHELLRLALGSEQGEAESDVITTKIIIKDGR